MDDRIKWNRKYRERLNEVKQPEPNLRLKALCSYLKGGKALDLACGLGGNSLFLAQQKFQVDALDISDVAVNYLKEQVKEKNIGIFPRVCDLS